MTEQLGLRSFDLLAGQIEALKVSVIALTPMRKQGCMRVF